MNIDRFFQQRWTLLGSRNATLALLCDHDMQLLAAAESQGEGLFANQQHRTWQERWILAEAVTRCEPDFVHEYQRRAGTSEQWHMASLDPSLPCPHTHTQSWSVARAQWLQPQRQLNLPQHWQNWWQSMRTQPDASQMIALYQEHNDNAQLVLAPLLLRLSEGETVNFINWLSNHLPAPALLPWIGMSCLGRFIPWLHSFSSNQTLQYAAKVEITWLTGNRQSERCSHQIWGMPWSADSLDQLRQSLPLAWHPRLWARMQPGSRGDYWTLFGGRLCVDN